MASCYYYYSLILITLNTHQCRVDRHALQRSLLVWGTASSSLGDHHLRAVTVKEECGNCLIHHLQAAECSPNEDGWSFPKYRALVRSVSGATLYYKRVPTQGPREGCSLVKSTGCLCRVLEFGSQHHVSQLTTSHNSSSRWPNTFWLYGHM